MTNSFGDRLKELRLKNKVTQEELARIIGTGKASISHYEINKRTPDKDKMNQISNYFNVSIKYLIGEYPFKNDAEAYYSIRIAALRHLHQHFDVLPEFFVIDTDFETYLGKVNHIISLNSSDINFINSVKKLLSKFDACEELSDLELLELSYILLSDIIPYEDFKGLVILLNYYNDKLAIKLDFEKIKKINEEDLGEGIYSSPILSKLEIKYSHINDYPIFVKTLDSSNCWSSEIINGKNKKIITRLGNNIKLLREKLNYSLSELSSILNIPKKNLEMYESGLDAPSYYVLIELSKVLQISIDDLLIEELPQDYSISLNDDDIKTLVKDISYYLKNNKAHDKA